MPFRAQASHDPFALALEELRAVDRLLEGQSFAARTSAPDSHGLVGRLASLSTSAFTPLAGVADLEAEQDHNDLCITTALGHLHRAIEITGGAYWNGAMSDAGVPWLLHTAVGLRLAAREYFERLTASDPSRFSDFPPLAPLEIQVRSAWPARGLALVAMLALAGAMLLAGLPPLALALLPLVVTLLWLRTRSSARAGADEQRALARGDAGPDQDDSRPPGRRRRDGQYPRVRR